jgi:hypothetical protein
LVGMQDAASKQQTGHDQKTALFHRVTRTPRSMYIS